MGNESFWQTKESRSFPCLRGRKKADVAIVGGGMTGLTCALWLSRTGLRVILLEAERLGCGGSSRCSGIVALSNGLQYAQIMENRGEYAASSFVKTQQNALISLRELSGQAGFGWREDTFYLTAETEKEAVELEAEKEAMKRAGLDAELAAKFPAFFPAISAICIQGMGMLNPALYLKTLMEHSLRQGVEIHERSRVTGMETNMVFTEQGAVHAPYIIVATGYPIINTPGWYFLRMEQRENTLIPLYAGMSVKGIWAAADSSFTLRPVSGGALLQICGSYVGSRPQKSKDRLKRFQGLTDTGKRYAGIEAYTADGLPFIGPYGSKTPNLFVAAGFNGRGIIGSMVAAQAISARILGLPSDGYEIYSGQRSIGGMYMPCSIGARYAGEWMKHPSGPRCPHMGCRLRYNPHSRLWECPCHGSRFDDIGHVLNAPSVKDAFLRNRR